MSRPPAIPGNPLVRPDFHLTQRTINYIKTQAARHGVAPGVFADRALGGPQHGGWNDEWYPSPNSRPSVE